MDQRIIKRRELLAKRVLISIAMMASAPALSLINCILQAFGSPIELPFYLSSVCIPFSIGADALALKKSSAIVFFAIAIISLAIFSSLIFLCKKREGAFAAVITLVVIDGVFGVVFIPALGLASLFELFTPIVCMIYHVVLVCFAMVGLRSTHALSVLPTEEDLQNADDGDPYAEFRND